MAKKIMLVEDDNNLREIYEARLSAEGYEIVAAENGEAALAMAAKVRPDMIISDVMMPKISGFEMLDILRNTDSLKNTKIIMLTALGQTEDNQRASSLGADRYLVKSQVTLEDIVKAAHDLLDDANTLATVAQPSSASVITPDSPVEPAAADVAAVSPEISTDGANIPDTEVTPAPVAEQPQTAPVAESATAAPAPQEVIAPTTEPPAANTLAAAEPVSHALAEPVTAAPSVISIPVSDGEDSTAQAGPQDQPAATPSEPVVPSVSDPATTSSPVAPADGSADTSSSTSLPVVEPPVEPQADAVGSLPLAEPPAPVPSPSQAAVEAPTSAADTAPATESAAPAASALAAQINDFLSQTAADSPAPAAASAVPSSNAVVPDTNVTEPVATDQPPQPTVEIPSIVAEPTVISDENNAPVAVGGPVDEVPTPEQLDSFSAPVIDAPEGASVPEPQDVPVENQAAPVETTTAEDNNADQLLAAAQDLAANASSETTTQAENATGTNRMRSIAPIAPDTSKPNIHQLLELEEAKNGATQAAQATQAPQPNVAAYNPTVAPSQPPAQEEAPFDPNSISL